MLSEWEKFAGWKVLRHFLENPSGEFFIRETARALKLSPRSAHIYCNVYEKDGILLTEKKANARMFRLNNSLASVKALKRFYLLSLLEEMRVAEKVIAGNPDTITIAVYGSHASGEYDEKSDIDFIVLSEKKLDRGAFVTLQKKLGKQIQLTELTIAEWTGMKRKNEAFALAVLGNHIIIHGARL
jgi:hypothetical protein